MASSDRIGTKIIALQITEKEAVVFSLLYNIGGCVLANDAAEAEWQRQQAFNFVFCHMNGHELDILRGKITQIAASISPEAKDRFGIKTTMRSDPHEPEKV